MIKIASALVSALLLIAGPMVAQGAVPCSTLQMPWSEIPKTRPPLLEFAGPTTVTAYTALDMIVGVRMAPVISASQMQCPADYSATLDNGLLSVFCHSGVYYVEVTHQSGVRSHAVVGIAMRVLGAVPTIVPPPPPTYKAKQGLLNHGGSSTSWVHSTELASGEGNICHGHGGGPDNTIGDKADAEGGSVAEFGAAVCALAGDGTVPLGIVSHGSASSVSIGGSGVNDADIDYGNADAYGAAMAGKVCGITFYSCFLAYTGQGKALMRKLAEAAGDHVSGYSEEITIVNKTEAVTGVEYTQLYIATTATKYTVDAEGNETTEPAIPPSSGLLAGSEGSLSELAPSLLAPSDVRLPWGYGTEGFCVFTQLTASYGHSQSAWDLNGDSTVDDTDLYLLVSYVGL